MEIIDAQIHAPAPPAPVDAALDAATKTLINVEIAREAMDSVGVDVALAVASREFIGAAVDRYPARFGGVVTFDHEAADLEDQVAQLRSIPGMIAGRSLVTNFRDVTLMPGFVDGRFERLYALAERHEVPLFFSTHGWAEAMEPVVQAHPGLTMVIDHIGVSQSPVSPPRDEPWDRLPGLLKLAQYPNVSVKLCGAPLLSAEGYPYKDVWPYLHQVLEAFGPKRLMWASDYTRLRMGKVTYSQCLDFLLQSDELSAGDKAEIFSGTARRVLRWPKPGLKRRRPTPIPQPAIFAAPPR
jgi:L-fuconolactonase